MSILAIYIELRAIPELYVGYFLASAGHGVVLREEDDRVDPADAGAKWYRPFGSAAHMRKCTTPTRQSRSTSTLP